MEKNIIKNIEAFMELNGEEIEKKIQFIVNDFMVKKRKKTEEDFKMAFISLLEDISNKVGFNLEPLYEKYVKSGRIDCLYNCLDLEFKVPGAIEPMNNYLTRKSANKSYIEEVQKQIKDYSKSEKINLNSILGIIFDGRYFIYVHYLSTDWYISEPEEVNRYSIEKFLKRVFSLQIDNKAVTVTNLINDFGFGSHLADGTVNTLYKSLETVIGKDKGVTMIFEQWKSLFREVSGYSYDTNKETLKEIKKVYGMDDKTVRVDFIIFSIHTYYALLIKLLVIETLYHNKNNKALEQPMRYNNEKLTKATMKEIENGSRFKSLGITNFLEGDFFGWYINVWNNDIYKSIVKILEAFNEYNYSTINLDEVNSRDLLKKLYNYLLPKKLRHTLGEYYSPDWLAQKTYNLMGINGNINKSFLDPTCGSGTFIVIGIKEIILNNKDIDKKVLLRKIIDNVHGFDLNPLAVISARANYIIALGDLLNYATEEIEIPIFHCDAMLTILEQPKGTQYVKKLSTRAGVYEIPKQIGDNKNVLYKVLDEFNNNITLNGKFDSLLWHKIIDICPELLKLKSEELDEVMELTRVFYEQINGLEKKGIREVWTQIIKNAFIPLFHEKVDFIIGNPPWVNWQTLPEDYRESIHRHWRNYKIFDFTGLKARLGNAHDDISVLLTYVVMDNFLKDNGEIGFIINQNLLQAYGAGAGFRKFMIREEIPVGVKLVEDYVDVEPFKSLGASNKTAIIIMQKNEVTRYPIKYKKWFKNYRGMIDSEDLLDSVLSKLDYRDMIAEPLREDDISSPWLVTYDTDMSLLKKLVGSSNYQGRKGIDASANAIYWVTIQDEMRGKINIKNSPENSRKLVPEVTAILEKKLVYPLVRGKDISKWGYKTPYSIIVPYKDNLKDVLSIEELKEMYPNTYDYFYNNNVNHYSDDFIDILVNRGIYKKHYKETSKKKIPPHVLYNIGTYTASPYKIIWKALQGKGMNACVIGSEDGKLILPDHNNIMVALDNELEAHYLCGIMNSKLVEEFIDAYVSWFKSAHILENINIPKFDKENYIHIEIANNSKEAHRLTKENKNVDCIERKIDELVRALLA